MAPNIKLFYFDMSGRAGPIRMVLDYAGIPFDDVRIIRDNWPALKKEMPWGQVPVLEVDGKKFGQSAAINKYVAKLAGLSGKNEVEDLEIDSVVETFADMKKKMMDVRREKDEVKKATIEETLIKETLPYFLQKLDDMAKENGGYLAAKRLTWADIVFIDSYETTVNRLKKDIYADYPHLMKVKHNVLAVPSIKEHIKNRKSGSGPPGMTPTYSLKNDI